MTRYRVMNATRGAVTFLYVVVGSAQVSTQVNGENRRTFEVAAIKPSSGEGIIGGGCHGMDSNLKGNFGTPPPLGMCVMRRVTVKMLVQEAYDFHGPDADQMVDGGPSWVESERFDVEAKAPSPAPVAEMRMMLQSLLSDRFGLRFHRQAKELSGYTLRIARGRSKLNVAADASAASGLQRINGGPLVAKSASITQLATTLSLILGRPVADETGLSGRYGFTLTFAAEEGQRNFRDSLPPEIRERLPQQATSVGPSLFTAVQEQLGLRLEAQKVSTEILVIDRVEKPSEN